MTRGYPIREPVSIGRVASLTPTRLPGFTGPPSDRLRSGALQPGAPLPKPVEATVPGPGAAAARGSIPFSQLRLMSVQPR